MVKKTREKQPELVPLSLIGKSQVTMCSVLSKFKKQMEQAVNMVLKIVLGQLGLHQQLGFLPQRMHLGVPMPIQVLARTIKLQIKMPDHQGQGGTKFHPSQTVNRVTRQFSLHNHDV